MLHGIGLGFRRDISQAIIHDTSSHRPSFIELVPENWMGIGGKWRKALSDVAEKYPLTSHGLSLSIGSSDPLDWDFLKKLKRFLEDFNIQIYSEHLSYTKCDNAHLYELLPIPFREDAVKHVCKRICQVQDFLERPIAIENVSYYTPVSPEMNEATFIKTIVEESGCQLLLDVNNVYVNAFNHGYDAKTFIQQLPLSSVAYLHMAGHEQESETLIIDTHGQPIIEAVYELFEWTIQQINPVPVLLERDFNIPNYEELKSEMQHLTSISNKVWGLSHVS